jgi:hypothetical protein
MISQDFVGLTESQQSALEVLIPLTEEERLNARERARANARRKLGPKPQREHFDSAGPRPERGMFEGAAIAEYPAWVIKAIGGMLVIAFVGAFATSAFSVFSAGRNHYLEAMPGGAGLDWQAVVVGLAIVLLAEFLTIASVLGARILFQGKWLWQVVMLLPITAGVVMAITANAVVAKPDGFWPWLVTIAPPVSVVFLSLILEQIALSDIKRRHANERAFQVAMREWQTAHREADQVWQTVVKQWEAQQAEPETLPMWRAMHANALREAIRAKNGKGRGRDDREVLMQSMTGLEWSAVVGRELGADQWFEELPTLPFGHPGQSHQIAAATAIPTGTAIPALLPARPALSGNGNGTSH